MLRYAASALQMFNPNPHIQTLPITAAHSCFVVDDALLDPQAWVNFAQDNLAHFQMGPHNAYPGLELRMPDAISARLEEFFLLHIRRLLGARRTLNMYSRLSMVTLPPEQLQARQWICHRDNQHVPDDQSIAASVLYLFKDKTLGGTSFFLPRKSHLETRLLVHDSSTQDNADFARKHNVSPGYLLDSNEYFERVCTVPPKWNRIIFYDGSLFHSSHISRPAGLSANPATGRLTLNGFFTCSRKARRN